MEHLEEFRRDDVNALSLTSSIGWTSLMNGFGGKDQEKLQPTALLPYKMPEDEDKGVMSEKTVECLVRAYKGKRLSMQVLGAAVIANPSLQVTLEQLQ